MNPKAKWAAIIGIPVVIAAAAVTVTAGKDANDRFLDDYEATVKRYEAVVEKGSMTSADQIEISKAQVEMAQRMQNIGKPMTSSQTSRFMELMQRLQKVMTAIQNGSVRIVL